jgi:hypothetical protein
MRRRPALAAAGLLALAALPLGCAVPAAAAHAAGEKVVVTGVVSDAQGMPLGDVQVVLEASRSTFSLRRLGRVQRDPVRRATRSNAQGEYALEWPWDSYYNHFEMIAGVPVRRGAREELQELHRIDVTRRIRTSPVVVSLQIPDVGFLRAQRAFLASIDSADERSVFERMGQPDKIETVRFPDHEQVTWWYFAAGRSYRFRAGALEAEVPFEPVAPLGPAPTSAAAPPAPGARR